MLRLAYNLLWHLALPLLPLRLWWRGRKEPGYRETIGERFGRYGARPDRPGDLDPRGLGRRDARRAAARARAARSAIRITRCSSPT